MNQTSLSSMSQTKSGSACVVFAPKTYGIIGWICTALFACFLIFTLVAGGAIGLIFVPCVLVSIGCIVQEKRYRITYDGDEIVHTPTIGAPRTHHIRDLTSISPRVKVTILTFSTGKIFLEHEMIGAQQFVLYVRDHAPDSVCRYL